MLAVSMQGCKSTKSVVPEQTTVNQILLDSISRSLFQKDSVYIGKSHWMEYHPQLVINYDTSTINLRPSTINRVDTIVIRDSVIAYRLKHVHDTTSVIKRDTIPIIQKVEVTKEVPRRRNWFDWMCYGVTGLLMLVLVAYIVKRLLPLCEGSSLILTLSPYHLTYHYHLKNTYMIYW